jgi:hypothetical protein
MNENNLLQYCFFFRLILFHAVLPGIYLIRNIAVTNGKQTRILAKFVQRDLIKG